MAEVRNEARNEARNEVRNEVRKEYIERGALEKKIDKAQELLKNQHPRLWYVNKKYFQGLAWARRLLLDAPAADVVEVVRCKNCKFKHYPTRCALWYGEVNGTAYFIERGDEFYCSYGEKKE